MSYQFKLTDLNNMVYALGFETYLKGKELFFKHCPYCGGGTNSKDKDTFSINIETGAFKCFRASCGKEGHFIEFARDFNYHIEVDNKQTFRKLTQPKQITTTSSAEKYLLNRSISKETAQKYKITTRKDNANILVFPFYDDNGILQFIKYRNTKFNGTGNKEWCEKNTKPILFGMNQCTDFEQIIITEGQIDSLSVATCGIKNAVSVPTGALGFTWLASCYQWLSKFKKVIVFGDNENGTMTLLDTLSKRLSQTVYAVQINDYLGEKDANDILRQYGKQAILTCIKNAQKVKLQNVKDLADIKPIDINKIAKIKTGLECIDRKIGGLGMGQVTLLTGKRGEGKSTFMSQLVAEALNQDKNVFIYSGELSDSHFQNWLDYQLAGSKYLDEYQNEYGDTDYTIKQCALEHIHNWYRGRAYIYDNTYVTDNENELENLTNTIERVIRQYNVEFICIDNLMTAMEVISKQENLYLAQSNFVGTLKKIAIKYDVSILLVAHPRKTSGELTADDVSGSSDVTNKVDIVLGYERATEKEDCNSLLSITKNRLKGILATGDKRIKLFFSPNTKRIADLKSTTKHYGWENVPDDNGDLLF